MIHVHYHRQDIPLGNSDMFFATEYTPDKEAGGCYCKTIVRKVRTVQRWDVSVGVGSGQPGNSAMKKLSLDVGQCS
jgi:hypothetical protein